MKNALIVTFVLIILGKISGFLRDLTIASVFGASVETDVFFIANLLSSAIFLAFYSTIPLAFMPLYIERLNIDSSDTRHANRYANEMILFYFVVSVLITVIAVLVAPYFIEMFAPTLDDATKEKAVFLARIFSTSFSLSATCAVFSAIQYAHNIRLGQQLSPLINNSVFIITVFAGGAIYGIEFAAIMTVIGWAFQLPIQYHLAKSHINWSYISFPKRDSVQSSLKLSIPILLAVTMEQALLATSIHFATKIETGAATLVNFAYKLASIPLSLGIMLITIYIYPKISHIVATKNILSLGEYAQLIFKYLLICLLPLVCIVWFEGRIVTNIAFGVSKLSHEEIGKISSLFTIFFIGIVLLLYRELANRFFYASQKGYGVFWVTAAMVVTNFTLCWWLVPKMGIVGVAVALGIAAAVATILQTALLQILLNQPLFKFYLVVSTVCAGVIMFMTMSTISIIMPGQSFGSSVTNIFFGTAVYSLAIMFAHKTGVINRSN
jgi:putative peptidoglycan lipid II flippase